MRIGIIINIFSANVKSFKELRKAELFCLGYFRLFLSCVLEFIIPSARKAIFRPKPSVTGLSRLQKLHALKNLTFSKMIDKLQSQNFLNKGSLRFKRAPTAQAIIELHYIFE